MNHKTDAGDGAKQPKPLSEKSQVTIKTSLITVVGSVLVAGFTTMGTIYVTRSTVAQAKEGASEAKTSVDELKNQVADATAKQGSIAVPAGTIIAYAGPTSDESALKSKGWLPCDGRQVNRTDYNSLFKAIGETWGEGDRVKTFQLPDLRGMFLRGVNGERADQHGDPDAGSRTNLAQGGSKGNTVGSFQDDTLQNIAGIVGYFNAWGACKGTNDGPFYRTNTGYREQGIPAGAQHKDDYDRITMDVSRAAKTSTETRPKNAYVNYLIKY